MMAPWIRCTLARTVPMDDVEASLALALVSTQALHGEAATRLEVQQRLNRRQRTCDIDTSTPPGHTLATLFIGFLTREFGAASFTVQPLATRRTRAARRPPTSTATALAT